MLGTGQDSRKHPWAKTALYKVSREQDLPALVGLSLKLLPRP